MQIRIIDKDPAIAPMQTSFEELCSMNEVSAVEALLLKATLEKHGKANMMLGVGDWVTLYRLEHRLRFDDGTLDAFVQDYCARHDIDLNDHDPRRNPDWGGIFGVFFTGADNSAESFTPERAEQLCAAAVEYGNSLLEDAQ